MRRIGWVLLVCIGLAPAQEAPARAVHLASIVPEGTLLLAEYDDLGGMQDWMKNTSLGRICSEPDVQAFVKPFLKQLYSALDKLPANANPLAAAGLTWRDFQGIEVRRAGIAVIDAKVSDRGPPNVDLVMTMEFRSGGAKAIAIAKKLHGLIQQRTGVAFAATELAGRTVYRADVQGVELFAHLDTSRFLMTTTRDRMVRTWDAIAGKARAATLANSARFKKVLAQMDAKRHGLLAYVDAPRAMELLNPHFDAEDRELVRLMKIDKIEALAMADVPAGTRMRTEFAVSASEPGGVLDLYKTYETNHRF